MSDPEGGGPAPPRSAPAAERNAAPIRAALAPRLAGRRGLVLEIGSGTGQHAAEWAAAFPSLDCQPSNPDPESRASIAAWAEAARFPNLRPPLALDATAPWPDLGPLAAVIAVNVIHIAPWAVAEAILAGSARSLAPGGLLIFYGPFREAGRHTAESNARFDAALRARDPSWRVRDREALATSAAALGFAPPETVAMPANNRLLVFAKP